MSGTAVELGDPLVESAPASAASESTAAPALSASAVARTPAESMGAPHLAASPADGGAGGGAEVSVASRTSTPRKARSRAIVVAMKSLPSL